MPVVTFYAYSGGKYDDSKSIAGHAFVKIADEGVYGFYPDESKSKLVKWSGCIKDDNDTCIQDQASFEVSDLAKDAIMNLVNDWKTRQPHYLVGENDCVSFIYRVVDKINEVDGLNIDYNHTDFLPKTALKKLKASPSVYENR